MFSKINSFLFLNLSTRQTLAKNVFWLFVGELISRALKIGLIIYAARILGADNWGVFSYVVSVVGLYYIFCDLGLDSLVIRELSQKTEEQFNYISTAFYLRLILLGVCGTLILVTVPTLSKIPNIEELLLPVSIFLGLDLIRNFFLSINRALEKMEKEAFVTILTNFFITFFGLVFLFHSPSAKNLAYAYVLGSIIGFIFATFSVKKCLAMVLKNFSKKYLQAIISIAWPLFLFGIIGAIMTYTDVVMLGWWAEPTELGLYAAAQRLIQFLIIIPSLLGSAILPLFSKLTTEDPLHLKPALERMVSLSLLLAFPIFAGGIVLGKDIVVLLFGVPYAEGGTVFQIFLFMLLVMFPIQIINNFIFSQNLQKKFVRFNIMGAVLNIVLNIIFIPKYGIEGAAWATAISSALLGIATWQTTKSFYPFYISPHLSKILLASFLMVVATLLLKSWGFTVLLNIGFSAFLFLLVLHTLEEPLLQEVKKIFKKS